MRNTPRLLTHSPTGDLPFVGIADRTGPKIDKGLINNLGFTVIELCTVLAIISIFAWMMHGALYKPLMRTERMIVIARLKLAIALAKQHAFSYQSTLILCSSLDAKTCSTNNSTDWSAGFILIKEPTNSDILKIPTLIHRFSGTHFGTLTFEHFVHHLKIHPHAHTDNAGTFTYCPKRGNHQEAAALVINKALRVYELHKRNPQGVLLNQVSTAQEKPIQCR